MSYVLLACNRTNDEFIILDTHDLITEVVTRSEFRQLKRQGVPIKHLSRIDSLFGLAVDGNSYSLYVHGYGSPIYKGEFQIGVELYAHSIHVEDYGIVGNKICIAIVCDCYHNLEFESPVVLAHVLAVPMMQFKETFLSAYTASGVYICSDEALGERQLSDCINIEQSKDIETDAVLRIFGVDYGTNVPYHDDLCKRLKHSNV